MKALVVDASVAIKWFLPEIHFEEASKVLKSKWELLAPYLIWTEVSSALLKKVRFEEINAQEASDILKDFIRFPLQTYSSKFLLNSAWQIAQQSRSSIYDSLYLALAINRDCSLVTADRKFYDSMIKKPFGSKIIWVEDIK